MNDPLGNIVNADNFMPPADWGVSAHVKHLYNPYVYFWRWGTWKVFDHHAPANDTGIVCFITVAGFLNGPGFQKMRAYLRDDMQKLGYPKKLFYAGRPVSASPAVGYASWHAKQQKELVEAAFGAKLSSGEIVTSL